MGEVVSLTAFRETRTVQPIAAEEQARLAQGQLVLARKVISEHVMSRAPSEHPFVKGGRVYHLKFGNGTVTAVDGKHNKVKFDIAGKKRVLGKFVDHVGETFMRRA